MIEFRCRARDRHKNPVVSNVEIQEYAEALVGDYKPSLLNEPSAINPLHFVESYLGATVDYQDIFYKEGEPPIAGATVFNDDVVPVFDREHMCVRNIPVSANTILIDNAILEKGKEGFCNFTVLHEGGHFTMHPEVFRRDDSQISLLPEMFSSHPRIACRKTSIGASVHYGQFWTPEQRREHQANVFAAFVAMPKKTFLPFAQELVKKAGFDAGVYIENDLYDWCNDGALVNISHTLATTYGVSRTAATIHMRTLGLVQSKDEYMASRSQTVVAF